MRFKPSTIELVLLVFGLVFCLGLWEKRHADADIDALHALLSRQIQVNDSTATVLAGTRAELSQLRGLQVGAKEIGGKLVAGVAIRVPKRDTLIVHDTLATERRSDSTRVGSFRDSTFAGIVDAVVTAPPFPAALRAELRVTRPEFRPEVGFVQVGTAATKTIMAVVTWQGERYELEAPFFDQKAVQAPVRRFVPWAEGFYGIGSAPELAAGGGVNVWRLQISPTIRQRLAIGESPSIGLTARWSF